MPLSSHSLITALLFGCAVMDLKPLSANPTKWSNTLKQFVGNSRRTVRVCLTIIRDWPLKG